LWGHVAVQAQRDVYEYLAHHFPRCVPDEWGNITRLPVGTILNFDTDRFRDNIMDGSSLRTE
jgi:hypothetical protein